MKKYILDLTVDFEQITPTVLYHFYSEDVGAGNKMSRSKSPKYSGAFHFDATDGALQVCVNQFQNGKPLEQPFDIKDFRMNFAPNLISPHGNGPAGPGASMGPYKIEEWVAGSENNILQAKDPIAFSVTGSWQLSGTLKFDKQEGPNVYTFDPEVIIGEPK